jgi:energy-coupling factor transport system ATP-binding protein
LLAAAAGLLDDGAGESEGVLEVDGLDARAARIAPGVPGTSRTGLLLQDPDAQTVLARCGDDVAFGLENHGLPAELIWPRVDDALRLVGFPYGRAHATSALSGGERQRLALAGVVAMRPGLLMLDEPTAMIDPDGARLLVESVAGVVGLSRHAGSLRSTVIVVEHRVEQWLGVVDRVVVLEAGGGVIADGPALDVLADHGPELFRLGVWVPPRFRAGAGGPAGATEAAGASEPDAAVGADVAARSLRAPAPAPVLTARDLAVQRGRLAPVLTGVDLDVVPGEVVFLTGPNGSGKSTLALALAGLTAPAGGALMANPGLSGTIGPHPVRWRARDLVTRIGTVFQEPQHQFVAGSVEAELAVGPRQARVAATDAARRCAEVLGRLRLGALALANPFTLSGGEQRRLSVATALVTRPGVLVLDEPTFGQDAVTWAVLVDLLRELLGSGTAIVCATHDRDLVETFVDEGRGRELRVGDGTVRPVVPGVATAATVVAT